MVKRLLLFLIPIAFLLSSCASEHSQIVLAEYGDREITMAEFEEVYSKNAGGVEQAKKDSLPKLKNFLELYTNFKMKLRDAEVRGYDKNPALVDELEDYKKKVGVTYLLEKQIVEPGIKDLYEKRKEELRISHIMFRSGPEGDEQAAQLANTVLDSIKNGADFSKMASAHSQDNFSKDIGGDIFYITAGQLPAEFEDASYSLSEGEVYAEVVKTQYGYHIIKLTERKERIPQVKASHILIGLQNQEGPVDSAEAKAKAEEVYAKAKQGEDFAALAEEYSDDTGSKANGGDLGFFERRMMVKEFDEAVFNLEVGEISDIVKTNFGYHIIKLTDKKPYPSFEEERENLKKVFQNARYQAAHDELINRLKTKYNYSINESTLSTFADISDSIKVGNEHPRLDEIASETVYSYNGNNINVSYLYNKMNNDTEFMNKLITDDLLDKSLTKVSTESLLEEEALDLERTNPEFASLMNDYRNGIYIFKLQEDEVWNKINVDSVKLREFYNATKEKYVWPDRVEFSEIFSRNDSLINHYHQLLKDGENFDSLAAKFTERPGFKEKAGYFGLHDAKSSSQAVEADKLKNPGDFSGAFTSPGGHSIVKLIAKEPSRIKTFEEAKAEVSGAFQEAESKRLEDAYLQSLRKRYEPVIHFDKLSEAFKSE
jgi:peptidyl-prolyl cis-trans isomerase SurA